ncbi:hypothetical protein Ccr2_gp135c [Caulobacter phage Ccr2]|nr:hypothetical protein Ccr10_gp136c [Caulobacter phage Ccr10]ARB14010.1 hypothetical protein Ccr2_gp135c [Caulobacter phage Ccr2]
MPQASRNVKIHDIPAGWSVLTEPERLARRIGNTFTQACLSEFAMRLGAEPVILETIGVEEEQEFTIKASGKAFRMLIDGLYSDKIGSMVREVTTNAYDSQLVSGYKGTFFVHAPNELRPEFYVRDYGVGMNHEKVMFLYSTLFESDKDQTDDLVGAFGLGSKSPFAYTSQFSVSCYDGDVVRHYTAAIGEGGRPRIMLQGTEECAEPVGVRVTVGVAAKDFPAFEKAIRNVALGYSPMFDTNIDLGQGLGTPQFEATDGTWAAYENSSLPSTWNVRQGCVIYPLANKGGLTLPHDMGRKWLITVPIGTVEPIPSREEIQYKPDAVEALIKKIGEITTEVEMVIWDKVKDIEPVVEFFKTYNKLKPQFLNKSVTHPATGLTTSSISFSGVSCIYKATFDQYRERWGYRIEKTLSLDNDAERTFYVIRDVSDLMDPSRDASTQSEFSQSETRRLARLFRLYLEEKLKVKSGDFLLAFDKPAKFWQCALPKAKFVEVDIDDLRGVVPRRVEGKKPQAVYTPPIRGLALAKRAGEQRAVVEVETDLDGGVAWVTSDQYRKKPEDTFVVANKFGIKHIYIASPTAQKHVEEANIPSLRAAVDAALQAKHKITLDECVNLLGKFSSSSTAFGFFTRAVKHCPAEYDALGRMTSSPLAAFFVALKPFLAANIAEWTERERSYLKSLYEENGSYKAPPKSKTIQIIEEGHQKVYKHYNHPVRKYLDMMNHASTEAQITACIKALPGLIKAIPLTLAFS